MLKDILSLKARIIPKGRNTNVERISCLLKQIITSLFSPCPFAWLKRVAKLIWKENTIDVMSRFVRILAIPSADYFCEAFSESLRNIQLQISKIGWIKVPSIGHKEVLKSSKQSFSMLLFSCCGDLIRLWSLSDVCIKDSRSIFNKY